MLRKTLHQARTQAAEKLKTQLVDGRKLFFTPDLL